MYLTFPCEGGTLVGTGGPGVAGNCTQLVQGWLMIVWFVVAPLEFEPLFAVPLESEQFLFDRPFVGLQLVV